MRTSRGAHRDAPRTGRLPRPTPRLPLTPRSPLLSCRYKGEKLTLDWGKAPLLKHHPLPLVVFNDSDIPATFGLNLRRPGLELPGGITTPYALPAPEELEEGAKGFTLAPREIRSMELSLYLDDAVRAAEELLISVKDSAEQAVSLVATGVGSSICCEEDEELKAVAMGTHYSNRLCTREIVLENKGRKPQKLVWSNASLNPSKDKEKDKEKAKKRAAAPAPADGDAPPRRPPVGVAHGSVFTVSPDVITLEPWQSCIFVVRGMCAAAGDVDEVLELTASIGNAKGGKPIFSTAVSATFVDPLIEFTEPDGLSFVHMHADGEEKAAPLLRKVGLKNVATLPLTLSLKCAQPFAVNTPEVALAPGAEAEVTVSFNPGFFGDRQSGSHDGKLAIAYKEHPQRDALKLVGECNYPNVAFDTARADFGCVLNGTPKQLAVTITNTAKVPAQFSWSFAAEGTADAADASAFDILPIRGVLAPGASDKVLLLFKGGVNGKARALALCEVKGGPEYELPLVAEASSVGFTLDKTALDFGMQMYNAVEEREVPRNSGAIRRNSAQFCAILAQLLAILAQFF